MRGLAELLAVAVGSILGGGLRLSLSAWPLLQIAAFPWPTLVANLTGSLLMGLLARRLMHDANGKQSLLAPLLLTGFCGGLTTFSVFSLETIVLLDDGRIISALSYVGLTMVTAIVGAWVGLGRR